MKRLSLSGLVSLVLTLVLTACTVQPGSVPPPVTPMVTTPAAKPTPSASARDYRALLAQLTARIASAGLTNYGWRSGFEKEMATGLPSDAMSDADNGETAYSQTNNQVEGVEEADIIQTDGRFLYLVANNRLYVIDTRGDQNLQIVSMQKISPYREEGKTMIRENPLELFLDDKNQRLILIVSGSVMENIEPVKPETPTEPDETSKPEETSATSEGIVADRLWYPYHNLRTYTSTRVYDIRDPASPVLLRQFTQDGSYTTARLIDNALYLVTSRNALYLVTSRYDYRIMYSMPDKDSLLGILPAVCTHPLDEDWKTLPADRITVLPHGDIANQTIISALDTTDADKEPDVLSLIGSAGTVYASARFLYVAAWNSQQLTKDGTYVMETDIHRFELDQATVREAGSGSVPGWMVNQFSMDEHAGYLRVATTTGNGWTNEENPSSNNLYVLDGQLRQVGKVTGMAAGETIKSVRFMGPQAYVVTFRTIDPLFVLDLSEPTAPSVLGELKIPGYSTYLHPYAENMLLGFGFEVVADGNNLIHKGLKVALFDISDFHNPREQSTLLLGGSGSFSEILYNHKSLMFSREREIIAFPACLTTRHTAQPLQQNGLCFQGLLMLGVNEDLQLFLQGSVSHSDKLNQPFGPAVPMDEKTSQAAYGYDAVYRAAFIGDRLYTFSGRQVLCSDLATTASIDQVELPGYDDALSYMPVD